MGTEAGTVGTAIDQRMRLAFTAADPVDEATLEGIAISAQMGSPLARDRMGAVGAETDDGRIRRITLVDLRGQPAAGTPDGMVGRLVGRGPFLRAPAAC